MEIRRRSPLRQNLIRSTLYHRPVGRHINLVVPAKGTLTLIHFRIFGARAGAAETLKKTALTGHCYTVFGSRRM